MTVFYSEYFPLSTAPGVEGRSQIDLTSTTFADLFAQAANYNGATTYTKGTLVYDQNSIWVYINSLPTAGNPPPTLPTVSNAYWELVGTTATNTFVWIAYANSSDGITFTDFTTGDSTTGGIVRRWMGVAVNKTSAVESTVAADYSWTKIVGSDGAPGASGTSPIFAYVSRDNIVIPTDTNGNNPILLNSGTNIWVYEGSSPLNYDAVGTTNGTWRVGSTAISPAGGITLGSISDSGSNATAADITAMSQDAVTVTYNIVGKSTTGVDFSISKSVNYTKNKGAVLDTTPPAQITFPAAPPPLTSSVVVSTAGDVYATLTATWNASAAIDLSYYEVGIKEGTSDSYIYNRTTETTYLWTNLKPNVTYYVKVRAVDKNDNYGTYSTEASLLTAKDNAAPSAPTNVSAIATFKNVFLSWTNPSDSDLDSVEVYRNTVNNSGTAVKIATVPVSPSSPGAFADSSISNGTLYYYWLKASDTSGNVSASFSNLTTSNLTSVIIAGTSGQFTCASTSLKIGQVVIISGTFGGTGSITGYTNPTTYVISATNGSTTFTLVKADGTTLTTTAGTPTGLTYVKHESAAVPAAIGATDIVAGSITADRIRAGAITADLIAVPAAGNYLNPNIQVGSTTGVTIGNPIGIIENNASATTISPGKIKIGTNTLSSWITGTDSTEINGGKIAANTISANKVSIGLRGVDISGITFVCSVDSNAASLNIAVWTSGGTITYTNNSGNVVTQTNVPGGSVTQAPGGIQYIYWPKPPEGTITATYSGTTITLTYPTQDVAPYIAGEKIVVSGITATTNAPNGTFTVVSSTTTQTVYNVAAAPTGTLGGTIVVGSGISSSSATGTANRVNTIVLGTYAGGFDLVLNYGRTLIDGSQITTGTVNADRLKANSAIVNLIQVGGSNFTINGAAQGAGKGTLTVSNGTVDLLRMGYLDSSTVGFQLKNSSNEVLISSTTSLSSISNSSISIAANGTLSGGGGGQVTIAGLGYTGALDATKGAVIGSNLTGTFTEAEFNARFNTGIIGGTYIKNASIDTAQIKDAAINSAKINNLAVTNAKIDNLTIGTEKIQELAITKIALAQLTSTVNINNGTTVTIMTTSFTKTLAASLIKLEASLKFEVTTGDKDIRGVIRMEGGGTLTYVGPGGGRYNSAGTYLGECDPKGGGCPGDYEMSGAFSKTWPLRVDGAGGGVLYIPLSFILYAQSVPASTSSYSISFQMEGGADYVSIMPESSFTVREEKR